MGLVDFLVPFAKNNVILFEAAVFALAVLSVFVAWYATKDLRKDAKAFPTAPPSPLTAHRVSN